MVFSLKRIYVYAFLFSFILLTMIITAIVFFKDSFQEEYIGSEKQKEIISQQGRGYTNNNSIGYEFLDNDTIVHIWNDKDDYFFNRSSGIQFTNHFNEYWTRNIFCLGYYSGEEWVKIYCADELDNFERTIITDNETYVNATLWKDITYSGYDMRLAIQYHLGQEEIIGGVEDGEFIADENLTITIYGRNIDTEDIPFELGFAWKVVDVDILGLGGDFIEINDSSYSLGDGFDLTFKEMNNSFYNIYDTTKHLQLDWNNNLDYTIKMYADGTPPIPPASPQDDFYVTLLINASLFSAGQEKSTRLYWIDADTVVDTNPSTQTDLRLFCGPYWYNSSMGIIFYPDISTDISYSRTINSGTGWSKTTIETGTIVNGACWYDRETPGNNGDLIHLTWTDSDADSLFYKTINITDGTQGTLRTVDATVTTTPDPTASRIAITKTVSGNIIVAVSTQVEIEAYKSADNFATAGTAIADPYETTTEEDWLLLFPADTADNNDAVGIFWDRSASAISIKMYNDSEDTWIETAIASSMVAEMNYITMDGSIRHSDGNILFGAHSDMDSAGDDLLTWDLAVDSIASPTITAKTNVFTDQAGSAQVAVLINQQNDDVFLAYIKGGTWITSVDVVFHNSTDGMDNWVTEQAYSETTDDLRVVHGGRTIGDMGGRVQWGFYNDDLVDINVNLVNDFEIPVSVGDTCTCVDDQNWEIDMTDDCTLSSACHPFNVTFINTGTFTCNALLNATSITGLASGQLGTVGASCLMIDY